MAPPSWTTQTQWDWLMAFMPACQEASKKNRYAGWLIEVQHAWFVEWPEEDVLFEGGVPMELNAEQKAKLESARSERMKKIATWFHNQKNKARVARSSASLPSALLSASKSTRAPQAREVYYRLFYDDEKKAIVQADLDAQRAALGRKLTRSEAMAVARQRVDQLFADSDESVKVAVAERLQLEKIQASVRVEPEKDNRTPQEYQSAINSAPVWIEQIMGPIASMCGWTFTVMGAGPTPEEGGEIGSFAVHFGKSPSGHTFGQATADFKEQFMRPLVLFAKGVYSRNERLARSLSVTTSPGASQSDVPSKLDPGPVANKEDRSNPAPPLRGNDSSLSNSITTGASSVQRSGSLPPSEKLMPDPLQALPDTSSSTSGVPLANTFDTGTSSALGALDHLYTFTPDENAFGANLFDAPFDFNAGMFEVMPPELNRDAFDLLAAPYTSTQRSVGAALQTGIPKSVFAFGNPYSAGGAELPNALPLPFGIPTTNENIAPPATTARVAGTAELAAPARPVSLPLINNPAPVITVLNADTASGTILSSGVSAADSTLGNTIQPTIAAAAGGAADMGLSRAFSPSSEPAPVTTGGDAASVSMQTHVTNLAGSTTAAPEPDAPSITTPSTDTPAEPTLPAMSGRPARQRKAPRARDASVGVMSRSTRATRAKADATDVPADRSEQRSDAHAPPTPEKVSAKRQKVGATATKRRASAKVSAKVSAPAEEVAPAEESVPARGRAAVKGKAVVKEKTGAKEGAPAKRGRGRGRGRRA